MPRRRTAKQGALAQHCGVRAPLLGRRVPSGENLAVAHRYDVIAIGNAIVDVLARADDDFLVGHGMAKGSMTLIDEAKAEAIHGAMRRSIEISGGSAANTAVGVASLGGRSAFIGKVKDDPLGKVFARDIQGAGVEFRTPAAKDGASTARSYIFVTPDGQRTMNTYLGAAQHLSPHDVAEGEIAAAAITYLEGYLWDPHNAKEAFRRAAKLAHTAKCSVALTLSDTSCVDRWREEFRALIRGRTVDILFANEAELHTLYQTADFDTAVAALREDAALAVVTRSEKGALVATSEKTETVTAFPVEHVVDTTGAGDLFAAGFLLGYARGIPHVDSLRLGALAAAEVISHLGARPERRLADFARENGLKV
jgi:sugar/nucleoside kinase (ribokinase family)